MNVLVLSLWSHDGADWRTTAPIRDLRAAVDRVLKWLASDASGADSASLSEIAAVGHRVVNGGEQFPQSRSWMIAC